jgi:predicted glycosyltransferase
MITHQPVVRLDAGQEFAERLVNGWLLPYLGKFKEIWIPDQPGSGLTDRFLPVKQAVRYIGWLSRFPEGSQPVERFPIMAVVSGPEPQRSLLEKKLRSQLRERPGKLLLVTGEPERERTEQDGNLEIASHLSSAEMERQLRAADLVISRSGYSTIMDLIALGKRAVFIPTPRQPEQEYFAHFLRNAGIAFCQDQENFTVDSLVQQSVGYSGFGAWQKNSLLLAPAIKQLLS